MTSSNHTEHLTVLELFAGTHTLADVFKSHGHTAYTVDWDPATDVDLHADIGALTCDDIIALCHGVPDVVWASPDCTTYSVAALGTHRRNIDGALVPQTDYAKRCDTYNAHLFALIDQLVAMGTRYWFVENPRGAFRKMPFVSDRTRYTVTYCQYGEDRMKPTDIFTNHPDPRFRPACKNGDPCHTRAPRGSRTGTQGLKGKLTRAQLPIQLCEHIVGICTGQTADRLDVGTAGLRGVQ